MQTGNLSGTDMVGDIVLTNVYAQGTLDTTNAIFNATGSATGTVSDDMTIQINSSINNLTGSFTIMGGTYDGQVFTITENNYPATITAGTLSTDGTEYTNATTTISTSCLNGTISAAMVHINSSVGFSIPVSSATIVGSTTGVTNGIEFEGSQITAGQYNDNSSSVSPGTC